MVFNSDFVLTLIGGFVIALFANRVSKFWNKNKVEIEKKGLTLDDMIEIKTGYHPNWLDAVVHAAVSWTDQYLSDPKMVRQITRKVIEVTDPNKRNLLTTELKGAVSKLESGIITKLDENLSPELKEIVNQVKEETAVRIVKSKVVLMPVISTPLQQIATDKEISVVVKAAAPGTITDFPTGPVTEEDLKRLFAESKARQELLKK